MGDEQRAQSFAVYYAKYDFLLSCSESRDRRTQEEAAAAADTGIWQRAAAVPANNAPDAALEALAELQAKMEEISPAVPATLRTLEELQKQMTELMQQQAQLEKEFLDALNQQAVRLRSSMQMEMTMESQAKSDAQARAKALSDAMEKLRKRNRELEEQLKDLEDRDLDRLQQLEGISGMRQREVDMLQKQRAQALQDAAESRAAKDQLERAIKQYERLLDALGIEPIHYTASDGVPAAAYAHGAEAAIAAGYGSAAPTRSAGALAPPNPHGDLGGPAARGTPYGANQQGGLAQFGVYSQAGPKQTQMVAYGAPGVGDDINFKSDKPNFFDGIAKFFGAKPDQDYRGSATYHDGSAMVGVGPGCSIMAQQSVPGVYGPPGSCADAVGSIAAAPLGGGALAAADVNETGSSLMPVDEIMRVLPALPQNLGEMDQFMLLTDEGPVTVRARASGSVAYLKRMISIQLFLSPRLTLSLTTTKGGEQLRDDVIIQPYAEGRISSPDERLLLTASPRPLTDFAPGAPGLPPLLQLRIRTMVRGTPQALTVVVKPVKSTTVAAEIISMLIKEPALQPVLGPNPRALNLYFSPVFVTPDVLLGRKQKHLVPPNATLASLQVVDDDIFYLSHAA